MFNHKLGNGVVVKVLPLYIAIDTRGNHGYGFYTADPREKKQTSQIQWTLGELMEKIRTEVAENLGDQKDET